MAHLSNSNPWNHIIYKINNFHITQAPDNYFPHSKFRNVKAKKKIPLHDF